MPANQSVTPTAQRLLEATKAAQRDAMRAARNEYLARAKQLDRAKLNARDQVTLALFELDLESSIASDACHFEEWKVAAGGGSLLSEFSYMVEAHPRTSLQDARNLLARAGKVAGAIDDEIANLRRGVDILVATPGRLLDHVQQRTVDLSGIEIFVLDEADRMLDMGFIRDIRKIIALLPKQRQNLMFSATFSPDIRELASGLLHNPVSVDVAARNTAAETVTQRVIETNREQKKELLLHLFETRGWHQVLIFARTKHGADALSRNLEKAGIKSAALHGNKSQGARTRALSEFKDGKLVALVATDIAARGIDIDSLPYVINYEIPNIAEDYVHRIGRTGRAGMEGEAISLVSHDERAFMRDIEKLIKRTLEREIIPGFEPSAHAAPRPVQLPRGSHKPQPQGKTPNRNSPQKPGGPQLHRSGGRHR